MRQVTDLVPPPLDDPSTPSQRTELRLYLLELAVRFKPEGTDIERLVSRWEQYVLSGTFQPALIDQPDHPAIRLVAEPLAGAATTL